MWVRDVSICVSSEVQFEHHSNYNYYFMANDHDPNKLTTKPRMSQRGKNAKEILKTGSGQSSDQ